MPDGTSSDLRPLGIADLLAAYRAEVDGSTEALTVAQNIAERLLADNLFGRLVALRDELQARLDDEMRSRQIAVEYAIDVLGEIVGEE